MNRLLFYCCVVLLFVTACGKKQIETPVSPSSGGGNGGGSTPPTVSPFEGSSPFTIDSIKFESSVYSDQQAYIKKDLDLITRSNFDGDTEGLAQFGVSDFSNRTMSKWLTDRVHYIVGENFSEYDFRVNTATYTYSPSVYSELNPALNAVVTVMSNYGTAIYLAGKEKSKIYEATIAGDTVVVKSPRVGIIKIGAGLFGNDTFVESSLAANISRVGTFFHEARHSDGNEADTGFTHALCTTGTFTGSYACEKYANGPYVLQSFILKKFYKMCTTCTTEEKTALQAMIVDKAERLLGTSKTVSANPEKIQ